VPLDYEIDYARRLVTARARGVLGHEDVISYQLGVWSKPEVAGFDELVDMTEVVEIAIPSMDAIPRLANLAARMDPPSRKSRLAIVAPTDYVFALGRMYETYRGIDPLSTKEARVFRTMAEALAFLRPEAAPSPKPPEISGLPGS
jgi:hypothetical protein